MNVCNKRVCNELLSLCMCVAACCVCRIAIFICEFIIMWWEERQLMQRAKVRMHKVSAGSQWRPHYFFGPFSLFTQNPFFFFFTYIPLLSLSSFFLFLSLYSYPISIYTHNHDVPFDPSSFGPENVVAISNFRWWWRTSFTFFIDHIFHVFSIMDGWKVKQWVDSYVEECLFCT